MGKFVVGRKSILLFAIILIFSFSVISEPNILEGMEVSDAALISGYEAYRDGDWKSATMFFKKAFIDSSKENPENRYMLIMSQMYSGNFSGAIVDCNDFTETYSDSKMFPYVQFQRGRALYNLGQADGAVLALSDFCHQNPENELYPSALYLIAECFYEDYSYEEAKKLYETIVKDYPDCDRVDDALFKLDTLEQKDREQKLLYLLKVTGEEYLSSKEDYERQLKQYQTEDLIVLRKQLNEANERIAQLEKAASDSLAQAQAAQDTLNRQEEARKAQEAEEIRRKSEEIGRLREKANQIEVILDYLYSEK